MNADTLAARAEQHERWARETTDAEIVVDHLTDARLFRAAAAALAEREGEREQRREAEWQRAALAWMRAQAKALDSTVEDDAGPLTCSQVIANALRTPEPAPEPTDEDRAASARFRPRFEQMLGEYAEERRATPKPAEREHHYKCDSDGCVLPGCGILEARLATPEPAERERSRCRMCDGSFDCVMCGGTGIVATPKPVVSPNREEGS